MGPESWGTKIKEVALTSLYPERPKCLATVQAIHRTVFESCKMSSLCLDWRSARSRLGYSAGRARPVEPFDGLGHVYVPDSTSTCKRLRGSNSASGF
jgi:hypothetical protein